MCYDMRLSGLTRTSLDDAHHCDGLMLLKRKVIMVKVIQLVFLVQKHARIRM